MVTKLLQQLIRFRTISHLHKENENALIWVKKELATLPIHTKIVRSNGYPSLIVTTKKTTSPKIWLVAHMDVVDGIDEMFVPRRIGSKLYGRGAFDMKFAIACYINLFKELGKTLPEYDLGIMITSDEELGGMNGVNAIINKGYSGSFAILPDGGENWSLQGSAKGVIQLRITSKGISAHGARPWLGKNAIETGMHFLDEVKQLFPTEPCGDREHFHDTYNLGKIEGGTAVNQVPSTAHATIDIRYVDGLGIQKKLKKITSIQNKYPGITLSVISKGSNYRVNKKNKFIKSFINTLGENISNPLLFINSHGSSDARFFVEKNIPVLLIRPVGGNLHSDNEWIDVNELQTFYTVLKIFITNEGRR